MKRLVILTVGKTHSGKTTFARKLEQRLNNSVVMDQDNQAEFTNAFYKKLQPKQGPNTLKHAMSQLIVDYVIEQTDSHLIICNSNRNRAGRLRLLEQRFPPTDFIRILVHFNLPDHVLHERVKESERSTSIFRSASTFEEVLQRQQVDLSAEDPIEGEADYLFVIRDSVEVEGMNRSIVDMAMRCY